MIPLMRKKTGKLFAEEIFYSTEIGALQIMWVNPHPPNLEE